MSQKYFLDTVAGELYVIPIEDRVLWFEALGAGTGKFHHDEEWYIGDDFIPWYFKDCKHPLLEIPDISFEKPQQIKD